MLIGIDPVILSLGHVAVRWFGLLALVGLGLAIWLSLRDLRNQGLGEAAALDALAWGLPAGVLAARAMHVLAYWDYYLTHTPELWQLPIDGLSLWGGLAVGGLVAATRLGRDAPRRRRILDAIVPYVALAIVIGRFGEFLDGQGQGLPSSLPWATQYTNRLAASPDFGVPRHPAQLYDALVALVLFGVLWRLPRASPAGTRLATFLVVYGAARIALGSVRLDPTFLFGMQIEQVLALGGVVVGLVVGARLLAERGRVLRRRAATSAAAAHATAEDTLAA